MSFHTLSVNLILLNTSWIINIILILIKKKLNFVNEQKYKHLNSVLKELLIYNEVKHNDMLIVQIYRLIVLVYLIEYTLLCPTCSMLRYVDHKYVIFIGKINCGRMLLRLFECHTIHEQF